MSRGHLSRGLTFRLMLVTMIGLMLAMLSGCGKKGPVRPKLANLLEPPAELTLQQQGKLFVLGWAVPDGQAGRAAEELSGFRIKRLTYEGTEGCPTCRDPQITVADIELRSPDPAQRIGNRFYWRDLDIRPGSGYRYAIFALALGGAEGPPATVHLAVKQPPPSPTSLHAEAGDTQVKVQWSEPDLPNGLQLIGYNLYRRQAKRPFPIVPLNAEPLQTTSILDRGLDNGRAYEYRVSALVRVDGQPVESMATPGALVTPQEGR